MQDLPWEAIVFSVAAGWHAGVLLQTSGLSTKQLRQEATALGMDCSWCLERSELLEVYKRAKQVHIQCVMSASHI